MDITMPLYIMLWAFALTVAALSVMLAFVIGLWIYLECKGAVGLVILNKQVQALQAKGSMPTHPSNTA